jgi:hypothetical protein
MGTRTKIIAHANMDMDIGISRSCLIEGDVNREFWTTEKVGFIFKKHGLIRNANFPINKLVFKTNFISIKSNHVD